MRWFAGQVKRDGRCVVGQGDESVQFLKRADEAMPRLPRAAGALSLAALTWAVWRRLTTRIAQPAEQIRHQLAGS